MNHTRDLIFRRFICRDNVILSNYSLFVGAVAAAAPAVAVVGKSLIWEILRVFGFSGVHIAAHFRVHHTYTYNDTVDISVRQK